MDLNDCVNDVQINSLQYCLDQDEIHATVSKSFIRVDMPLVTLSCSSVGAMTCTGSGDTLSAGPFCYPGSKLGERVNLKVNSSPSPRVVKILRQTLMSAVPLQQVSIAIEAYQTSFQSYRSGA